MSKNILIVESDAALSGELEAGLLAKGFSVQVTSDGKGCVDLVRRDRPDLVSLAVELPAGQNGYILCSKLKKDDDLKGVPVVIMGNPDGFAQHRKLKTHADEYVAKPTDVDVFVSTVGSLIGFPEGGSDVVEEEALSLTDLVDDASPEEIALESTDEATVAGDPDLEMLDAVFDEAPDAASEPPPVETHEEDLSALASLDESPSADGGDLALDALIPDTESEASVETFDLESLGEDDSEEQTQLHLVSSEDEPSAPEPASPARSFTAPAASSGDGGAELRELRSRIAATERALEEARARADEAESKNRDLETELAGRTAELEANRATGGKSDKEFFSLREASNRKDKEILKLKGELNEKDHEIVELRDREMQLEQQVSESSGEIARRDAQIKTLSARADQLSGERRKMDQQLLAAKEEARTATARLETLQAEFDQVRAQLDEASSELASLRESGAQLESAARQAQADLEDSRQEAERHRTAAESARAEADEHRTLKEQLQIELDAAKNQLESQAASHEEEVSTHKRRISELEDDNAQHEERLTRLYARIKGEEKVRERTKKALAVALQLMEDHQSMVTLDDGDDESAAA